MIAGNTMSGKSYFCRNCLKHRNTVFDVKFKKIMYCTPFSNLKGQFMDSLKEIYPDIIIHHGVPDLTKDDWIDGEDGPKLIILDDCITEVFSNPILGNLDCT